jgi:hypothetical protein
MRGFAVAAGGWDEVDEPSAPSLHLVEPADETPVVETPVIEAPVIDTPIVDAPGAAVVDLAEHRERLAAPVTEPQAIILAW